MGAEQAKVQSSLQVLRGTPVEVWSKSEGRWIEAVIGASKDVREPPPEPTAVLVLFKEVVGGRNDAYKWVKCEEVPQYIRARPEAKRQAGMMDSVASTNFGTMFENRSAFDKRPAEPGIQSMIAYGRHAESGNLPMASMGAVSHASIPRERPQEQPGGVMSSMMASVGLGQAPPMTSAVMSHGTPRSASMVSMASTIDQNSSRLQKRPAAYPMGSMASTIPEESPSFMASLMGSSGAARPHDPNVHLPPTMGGGPQGHPQGGVMVSMMGYGGNFPTSESMASMTSMVARSENKSPNRSPMSSMNGKEQPAAANPMSSFMSSMGSLHESFFATDSFTTEPPPRAAHVPTGNHRSRMQ